MLLNSPTRFDAPTAAAAIALADYGGIDALSMRRLAGELDAGAMTLYHYVSGKDELLVGMVDKNRALRSMLDLVADRVTALSSGMVQRLRLAFALLHRPPVLLLDEPGSHLDDDGRAMVARVVDQERRTGIVLIATNDEREWRLAEQRIELRGSGLGHPA